MIYKVLFFGKTHSGKTQLQNQITKAHKYEENARPTIAPAFFIRNVKKNPQEVVSIWDAPGEERFSSINPLYYKEAVVGVFCIDLTEKIDEQDIIKRIEEFRQYVPTAPIICVGTKSDSPKAKLNALDKIESKQLFADFIITSAKNETNVEELFDLICKHCSAKLLLSWNEAVATLRTNLKGLSSAKTISINHELTKLSDVILASEDNSEVSPKIKAKAIEYFANQCKIILEGEHSSYYSAVLSVAAAAIVLTVTALIGFSIGVACSWWTGPGAFFAGLLSGYTAAVTVASSSTALGVLTGGLTAYGLFKPSQEMHAINDFANTVASFDPSIVL